VRKLKKRRALLVAAVVECRQQMNPVDRKSRS
jgi:hypothetical protein